MTLTPLDMHLHSCSVLTSAGLRVINISADGESDAVGRGTGPPCLTADDSSVSVPLTGTRPCLLFPTTTMHRLDLRATTSCFNNPLELPRLTYLGLARVSCVSPNFLVFGSLDDGLPNAVVPTDFTRLNLQTRIAMHPQWPSKQVPTVASGGDLYICSRPEVCIFSRKMGILGQDASKLVDCSDVIPAPPTLTPSQAQAFFPLQVNINDVQQSCQSATFPNLPTAPGAALSVPSIVQDPLTDGPCQDDGTNCVLPSA
ncbi:hypothetical protein FB45DRAFT_1143623 [Roridomyces roridus]|uniref:Fungal ligninase C-terminal domain-containing protein n=1 Tax=Roridomyces roridus TaxID=1738132 RepID=A0AAD7C0M5_9AGAR|nr:hypothetical protein FB45DRAFT_1143623 [Roridomyces roridus]